MEEPVWYAHIHQDQQRYELSQNNYNIYYKKYFNYKIKLCKVDIALVYITIHMINSVFPDTTKSHLIAYVEQLTGFLFQEMLLSS